MFADLFSFLKLKLLQYVRVVSFCFEVVATHFVAKCSEVSVVRVDTFMMIYFSAFSQYLLAIIGHFDGLVQVLYC